MLYQLIGGKNQVKIFFFSKCLLKSKRKKNNNIYIYMYSGKSILSS